MASTEKSSSHNFRKIIITILSTLVLGAIGSGLWEKLGGPLFTWVTRIIISGINFCFSTYKDSIYKEAAYGFTEYGSTATYQLILSMLPLSYVYLLLQHPARKKKASEINADTIKALIAEAKTGDMAKMAQVAEKAAELKQIAGKLRPNGAIRFIVSSRGYYCIIALTCVIFVFSFISFTREAYVRAVIIYSNTTIQRVAPYIDQKTESKLWSQLRSVRTAQDYYEFYSVLQKQLKDAALPDYGAKPL